jgi:hypothetical protein
MRHKLTYVELILPDSVSRYQYALASRMRARRITRTGKLLEYEDEDEPSTVSEE